MAVAPSPALVKAVSFCMRPLVRLCIHHGIDYRQLIEILKETFVTVAERDFPLPGRNQTDSRISLITGVHRKDVHRLRNLTEDSAPRLPSAQRLASNIISFWLGTPELLKPDKTPLPVPRTAREGHAWSFAQMMSRFNQDMPARSLLDELVKNGILSVDHDDMVHLDAEALIPSKNIDQKAFFFSHTIHDHIAAAGENLCGANPPFLDRYVWYADLLPADAERLGVIAEKAAMRALKTVNEAAQDMKNASEADGKSGNVRIHFGTFYYKKQQTEESPFIREQSQD